MTGLECEIKKIIEETYCCEYTGDIKLEKQNNTYILKLFLHNLYTPLLIMVDCDSDENFIEFIKKDIKHRQLDKQDAMKLVRIDRLIYRP